MAASFCASLSRRVEAAAPVRRTLSAGSPGCVPEPPAAGVRAGSAGKEEEVLKERHDMWTTGTGHLAALLTNGSAKILTEQQKQSPSAEKSFGMSLVSCLPSSRSTYWTVHSVESRPSPPPQKNRFCGNKVRCKLHVSNVHNFEAERTGQSKPVKKRMKRQFCWD